MNDFTKIQTMRLQAPMALRSQIYAGPLKDGCATIVVDELEFHLCPIKYDADDLVLELHSLARDKHLRVVQ